MLGATGETPKLRAEVLGSLPALKLGRAIAADERAMEALRTGEFRRVPRSARALLAAIRERVASIESLTWVRYRLLNLRVISAFEDQQELAPGDRVRARADLWRDEAAGALASMLAGRCAAMDCSTLLAADGRGRRFCEAHKRLEADRERLMAAVRDLALEVSGSLSDLGCPDAARGR